MLWIKLGKPFYNKKNGVLEFVVIDSQAAVVERLFSLAVRTRFRSCCRCGEVALLYHASTGTKKVAVVEK